MTALTDDRRSCLTTGVVNALTTVHMLLRTLLKARRQVKVTKRYLQFSYRYRTHQSYHSPASPDQRVSYVPVGNNIIPE